MVKNFQMWINLETFIHDNEAVLDNIEFSERSFGKKHTNYLGVPPFQISIPTKYQGIISYLEAEDHLEQLADDLVNLVEQTLESHLGEIWDMETGEYYTDMGDFPMSGGPFRRENTIVTIVEDSRGEQKGLLFADDEASYDEDCECIKFSKLTLDTDNLKQEIVNFLTVGFGLNNSNTEKPVGTSDYLVIGERKIPLCSGQAAMILTSLVKDQKDE